MSRQRAYQIRNRAKGLCILCPAKRAKGSTDYCVEHLRAKRKRARKAAGCQPWREGGPGRPPVA